MTNMAVVRSKEEIIQLKTAGAALNSRPIVGRATLTEEKRKGTQKAPSMVAMVVILFVLPFSNLLISNIVFAGINL
jgi:hypothetical protein